MALNIDYVNFVTDQLSKIGPFETKKMFGGMGFFKEGVMFGMIGNNTFHLKVDDSNQPDFKERGMKPYMSDSKKKGMPYWEVPQDIMEDKEMLRSWVDKSMMIALKNA